MHRVRRLLSFLSAVVAAAPSVAADFWLRPDRLVATPGATVGAEIAVFGESSFTGVPSIARVSLLLGGSSVPVGVEPGAENQRGQRISATFVRPGWAVWSVDVTPPTEVLTAPELEPRLYLLHAPPSLRDRLLPANSGQKKWRVASLSTVKCIVCIGEPDATDQSWSTVGGNAWDLVPQKVSSALRVGQTAEFTVWAASRPAIGTVVILRSLTDERELAAQTGPSGNVALIVPTAGLWLASASHVQVSATDDSLLEVRSVSLVFEAR